MIQRAQLAGRSNFTTVEEASLIAKQEVGWNIQSEGMFADLRPSAARYWRRKS